MKRLLSVCLLMLCLCVPAFAGHSLPGGYCDCGAPGCICDPGESPLGNRVNEPGEPNRDKPADLGSESLLVLGLLLLMLRYKV